MKSKRRNRESGQVLVMTSLSLVAMFGLLGLAIDVGWMHFQVEAAQTAADAAANAAAKAAVATSGGTITCGSHNVICQAVTACPNPVPSSPTKNTDIACAYAQSNGFAIATGGHQNVTVTAGTGTVPTVSGVSVSYWVTVRVAETIPQLFSAVMGNTTGTISARATAAISGSGSSNCIYALDPTMQKAISASGGATVTSGCGIFVDSNSSDALDASGGSTKITAPVVSVNGNYNASGGATISPTPTTGAARVADPLASLPTPSYSGCDYTNKSISGGTTTLTYGVYCGGITVSGGAHVTFSAGTYILNGGGFTVSGGSTVTGSGVMFYDTGTNSTYKAVNISGGSSMTLSAETSGSYVGILFYQDRAITSNNSTTISGGSSEQLTGTLYFPTTAVNYSGGSAGTVTAIVADSVVFSGASYLGSDATGTLTGLGGKQTANLIE